MTVVIWIAKFIFSFLSLVVLDKLWNLLKTWKSNHKIANFAK